MSDAKPRIAILGAGGDRGQVLVARGQRTSPQAECGRFAVGRIDPGQRRKGPQHRLESRRWQGFDLGTMESDL